MRVSIFGTILLQLISLNIRRICLDDQPLRSVEYVGSGDHCELLLFTRSKARPCSDRSKGMRITPMQFFDPVQRFDWGRFHFPMMIACNESQFCQDHAQRIIFTHARIRILWSACIGKRDHLRALEHRIQTDPWTLQTAELGITISKRYMSALEEHLSDDVEALVPTLESLLLPSHGRVEVVVGPILSGNANPGLLMVVL